MGSGSKIAWPSVNQMIGISVCTIAATPMAMLVVIINDMSHGVSFVAAAARFWPSSLLDLLDLIFGFATISLFALPSVIAIGIGAYALAMAKHDTFMISTACGAVIGYVALSITVEVAIGGAIQAAALLMFLSSITSALYWLTAVRRDRNRRRLVEQHEQALHAME
jgi:hypothetical protein